MTKKHHDRLHFYKTFFIQIKPQKHYPLKINELIIQNENIH
jgi:hypothetical protein